MKTRPSEHLIRFLFFVGCILLKSKAYAMQIHEPEYYLKLDMHGCPYIIDVNGVELERNMKAYSSNSIEPINHWVRDGENTISVHFGPEKFVKSRTNESSICNVSVWVKGTLDGQSVDFRVADLEYMPNYDLPQQERHKNSQPAGHYKVSNNQATLSKIPADFEIGEVQIGQGEFETVASRIYRTFTASVPFPEWAFFSAETISFYPLDQDKYETMKDSMWPMVTKLWDMFENQEIDKILPLFEARSKELDMAYYREPGYSIKSFENDLRNVYKAGYPILRKENKKMSLAVSYNEKLVTIVNAATRNGTVMFYDKSSDSVTFFDVVWMKKDGKWIIIR